MNHSMFYPISTDKQKIYYTVDWYKHILCVEALPLHAIRKTMHCSMPQENAGVMLVNLSNELRQLTS